MAITQDEVLSVSTHGAKLLLRGSNMDTFTTNYGEDWVDPLTPRMLSILEQLKKDCVQYAYVDGRPLTTISQELYGTTSAWWVILYINGYMHPDEISSGASLKVPSPEIIQLFLQSTKVNNIGQTVTT